ncbi:hypothetical protein [Alteromonas sp. NFXS44]
MDYIRIAEKDAARKTGRGDADVTLLTMLKGSTPSLVHVTG